MKGSTMERIGIPRKLCSITAALLLVIATPFIQSTRNLALAEEPVPDPTSINNPSETTPPEPSYVYNEETNRWENGTYSWDPVTNKTTPLQKTSTSYNPATGRWDTTEWKYNPETQTYVPNALAATVTPSAETDTLPDDIPPDTSNAVTTQNLDTNKPITSAANQPSKNTPNKSVTDTSGSFFDGFYDTLISVSVGVTNSAQSGNAVVSNNTYGGSALSGDAHASVSVLNSLQSSLNTQGHSSSTPNYYELTIQGGHYGDLHFDPRLSSGNTSKENNLTVTNGADFSIQNDISVTAISGDATVTNNNEAGDASTGAATAAANLMNIVNSSVSADESFIAVVNIIGDLEGDVLVPSDFMNQLNASAIPKYETTFDSSSAISSATNYNSSTNVSLTAESGDAQVSGNTTAGSAQSGAATTKVTVYDISSKSVTAQDAILVFVNVMGEWVGFITDAPTGARSAMITDGDASVMTTAAQNTTITDDTTISIENNVEVAAYSGDATVQNNTKGGNATTGATQAMANIVNISDTSFNMSGWFGIFMINVFGNWYGSFGTDTAFGGFSTTSPASPSDKPIGGENPAPPVTSQQSTTSQTPRIIGVVVRNNSNSGNLNQTSAPTSSRDKNDDLQQTVLSEKDTNPIYAVGNNTNGNDSGTGLPLTMSTVAFSSIAGLSAIILLLRWLQRRNNVPSPM
jgi:hypothetical protein